MRDIRQAESPEGAPCAYTTPVRCHPAPTKFRRTADGTATRLHATVRRSTVDHDLVSPGQPLAAPVTDEMENRLGADFSHVPTHTDAAPPVVHEALRGPGAPLDAGTRNLMEERLGTDFSHVRIHTDERAAASARAVNAVAYTVGSSIVFNSGRYAPRTDHGQRLLAHELVHTIQQGKSGPPLSGQRMSVESPASPAEDEARLIAAAEDPEGVSGAPLLRRLSDAWPSAAPARAGQLPDLSASVPTPAIRTSGIHLARITLEDYDKEIESHGGEGIIKLINQGKGNHEEGKKEKWAKEQTELAETYLSGYEKSELQDKERGPAAAKAFQMVFQKLGEGQPLKLPPSPAHLLQRNAMLFRGTTLVTKDGGKDVFPGSEGRQKLGATPTSPDVVKAVVFALKKDPAVTDPSSRVIVYGPISNVSDLGFNPPDTMSVQEQELTVKGLPVDVAKKLGKRAEVEKFRRALKMFGVDLPEAYESGQQFDNALKSAGQLTPKQTTELIQLVENEDQLKEAEKVLGDIGALKEKLGGFVINKNINNELKEKAEQTLQEVKSGSLEEKAELVKTLHGIVKEMEAAAAAAREKKINTAPEEEEEEFTLFD